MRPSDVQKGLTKWFDRRSEYHDELYYEGAYGKYTYALNRIHLKLMSRPREGERILDIGCGTGQHLISSVQVSGGIVVGLDISRKAVSRASRKVKKMTPRAEVHLVVGDALNLPFKHASFDRVLLLAVLEHIPVHNKRRKAITEALQVLTLKGKLIIAVPKLVSQTGLIHRFKEFSEPDLWTKKGGHVVYNHSFSENETRSLIMNSGGVILDVRNAEGWGIRGIMPVARDLMRRNLIPKWFGVFVTLAQYFFVRFSFLDRYCRGILAITMRGGQT